MSVLSDTIRCTGCDYEGGDSHRPITLLYRLPDGREFELWRQFGWCHSCGTMTDMELRFDAAEIKAELASLEARTRRPMFLLEDWLRSVFRRPESELRQKVQGLLARLEAAEIRRSGPRCLRCGSEETRPVTFGSSRLSMDFTHACGGRLKYEHGNSAGVAFHFAHETILLDVEGRRIDSSEE